MDLVERYIEAIKFWLPKHLKEDVAAELREDIRCEIEEAEREKGRPLTEDEVAAILKARGAPLFVASRYLPQRALIGPELYPLYILALKVVAVFWIVVPLMFWIAKGIFTGSLNVDNVPLPFGDLLSAVAVVTIIFAVIEYQGVNPAKKIDWNPKTLRPVIDTSRIKRGESVGQIIGGLILIGFYAAGYLSLTTYHPFAIQTFHGGTQLISGAITLSPQWVPFWQFMVTVIVAEIALSAVNLFKPYWSGLRIVVRLAIDLTKTAAFFWLLQSHLLRDIAAPGMNADSASKLVGISDTAAQYAGQIGAFIAVCVVIAAITRTVHLIRRPAPALA